MGDPRGFLNVAAEYPKRRPVDVRIQDWREVYQEFGPYKKPFYYFEMENK